ncbi:rhomboid family intramembrane serine protease [Aquabacterium sp.]|uniref:rhomboid family intramembrane serine protease n=1 Tax=Aquabacterium sp. TaxID=1872578 RepID=UPI0037847047
MPPLPPVTQALMLICTAVFCVQWLWSSAVVWLALWPLASGNFAPWQVLTYVFLSADLTGLIFTLLGLWLFGSSLEQLWGQRRYIQMLVVCGLSAAIVGLLAGWLLGSGLPEIGLSGAMFGLLLAYAMLFPDRQIMLLIPPIPVKAKIAVMVFAGLALLLSLLGGGGFASFAHLAGGMLGGWLMILYWRGRLPFGGGGGGGGARRRR